MTALIGAVSSGLAIGAEGAATINANTPTALSGRLDSVYIQYVPNYTGTTDVCVNGTFDADSDWTKGALWTIPGTKKATAAAATENLTAAVAPLSIAAMYYVVYDLVVTTGSVRFSDGVNHGTTRTASGTYSELFTAGATAFKFDPVADFTGTIDNVKIYEFDPHLTTEITIATAGVNLPAYTMLTYSSTVTDALINPRKIPHGLTGVALNALTIAEPFPVADYLNVKIDLAVAGDSINVWFLLTE